MDGLLLVDKPGGWTSFDVVNKVRGVIARDMGKKPKHVKVGHIGTLDPAATGLLVLCIGAYTKKVSELIGHDKEYRAEITLGMTSSTGDSEGEIKDSTSLSQVSRSRLEDVLKKFVGSISQIPPKHSALKVNGKRAYELARAGKGFRLEPRRVEIYMITLESYSWPVATITCRVSSGTYIRTLAEDIGEALGVGGYLSGLRRTTIENWHVENAVDPTDISIDSIRDKLLA